MESYAQVRASEDRAVPGQRVVDAAGQAVAYSFFFASGAYLW